MCHNSRVTELHELVINFKKASKVINKMMFQFPEIHMYNIFTQTEF